MSFLSQLKAQETGKPKAPKTAPVTFVGHIAADELEARIEAMREALPAGWKLDDENVKASLNPATGMFQRYLMARDDTAGSNITIYNTGSVSISRPDVFVKAWGEMAEFGIVEGKAVANKWVAA